MEFKKMPYLRRIWKNYRGRRFSFVEIAVILVIYLSLYLPYMLLTLLPIVIPLLVESYIYIYRIYIQNDNVYIFYLAFNKEKSIKIPNKNLRIIEYKNSGAGAKTRDMFHIVKDLGKGHITKIIRQYKIEEWSKQENIEMLKEMMNKSKNKL